MFRHLILALFSVAFSLLHFDEARAETPATSRPSEPDVNLVIYAPLDPGKPDDEAFVVVAIKNNGAAILKIEFNFDTDFIETGMLDCGEEVEFPATTGKGVYWAMLSITKPDQKQSKGKLYRTELIEIPSGDEVYIKVGVAADNRSIVGCKVQALVLEEQRVVACSKLGDEPNDRTRAFNRSFEKPARQTIRSAEKAATSRQSNQDQ